MISIRGVHCIPIISMAWHFQPCSLLLISALLTRLFPFALIGIDVTNASQILATRRDSIARFIHIIQPLRQIYKLSPNSVHIFADTKGGTIAFNRNASLFLNLRYYEAWREF